MELTDAMEILAALRDGRHPATGAEIPAAEAAQHPQVVRALFVVLAAAEPRAEAARRRAPNGGKRWSPEEDEKLEELNALGIPASRIAAEMGRSVYAVNLRLDRLGYQVPGLDALPRRFPEPSGEPAAVSA